MMKVALALSPSILSPHSRNLLRALEQAGLEEIWVTEELFDSSGPVSAAFALSSTESMRVGMGVMTTAIRSSAISALEVTNLEKFWPGRLIVGLGHGAAKPLLDVSSARSPKDFPSDLREITSRLRTSAALQHKPAVLAAAGSLRQREAVLDVVDGYIISWMTPLERVKELAEWGLQQQPAKPMSLMSLFSFQSDPVEAHNSSCEKVAKFLSTTRKTAFASTQHESEVLAFESGMRPSESLIDDLSVTGDPKRVRERLRTLSEIPGLDRVILYVGEETDIDLLVEELPDILQYDHV